MSLTRFCSIVLVALITVVSVAGLVSPVSAQAESIHWERYDVDVTVLPNGDAQVVETQTIRFIGGPFSQGFAEIPLLRSDGIEAIRVTQEGQAYDYIDGEPDEPFTFYYDVKTAYAEILWAFAPITNERRTFELAYTLKGVVGRSEEGDQLQLMAVSNDLDFSVDASTVTIHLPAPLVAEPDSIGARTQWKTSADAQSITFIATGGVQAKEGIAVDLIMQSDPAAAKPKWQLNQEQAEAIQAQMAETLRLEKERQRVLKAQLDLGSTAVTLALFLLLPGALYAVWFFWGRDPSSLLTPDYLSEPPSNLPPGLVGVLIDERADLRDLTATLIDLARRGYLVLEEVDAGKFFASSDSVQLKRTSANHPTNLRFYESLLYSAPFGTQATVRFDQLPLSFFESLPDIEAALYTETVKEGLFRVSPGEARAFYRNLGLGVIGAAIGVGLLVALILGSRTASVILPALPIALFGVGLIITGPAMPARTRKGAEEAAKWRAFQKYLGNIKQYGGVTGAAEKFETYLPYAIAFGLERRWVAAFTEPQPTPLNLPAPTWYHPKLFPQSKPSPANSATPSLINQPAAASGMGGPAAPATSGPGSAPSAPVSTPDLNSVGQGVAASLNQMGTNFVQALNTVGTSFASPPATWGGGNWVSSESSERKGSSSSGGSWGGSSRSSSSSHRGSSSSSFRSSRGSSGGRSSFRSGGSFRSSSGGGRRGFR